MLVSVDMVLPNPRQPRRMMHPEELQDLTASIREHGVLQPLIVTPGDMQGRYILIAGERRLQAARLAGLATVPVLVRPATDQQRLELAIIENVQRSDLSALEQAEAYRQLAEDFNLSHEEIAARVGKSRVAVSNTLRLLKLPDPVKRTRPCAAGPSHHGGPDGRPAHINSARTECPPNRRIGAKTYRGKTFPEIETDD
jgi:ParB family chromosome partitioning protein